MAETGAARYLLAFIYSGCKSQLAECRVLLSAARAEQRLPGARKLPPEAADEIAKRPLQKNREFREAQGPWASH